MAAAFLFFGSSPVSPMKFYPDDPLRQDYERVDVPVQPKAREGSELYERFETTLGRNTDYERPEAANVNTLDEVPDSDWFTNRRGVRAATIDDNALGPDPAGGPDMTKPWRIVSGKARGMNPGFQIVDGRGDRYVVKMERSSAPELASSADAIVSRFFYAVGFNVPANTVEYVHPDMLVLDKDAKISAGKKKIAFKPALLREMIARLPRDGEGRIRVMASKFIPGELLGPFDYFGTRGDDPNDVFAHQDRRELRGYRVFCAWLNHDDTKTLNTMDTWIEEGGKHHVRHYLMDFGAALGAGNESLILPNSGFHYWVQGDEIAKAARTFGFWVPPYRKAKWPTYPRLPNVGRFESVYFKARDWKPELPNAPYNRMTDRDAFWAAKIIMSFTPDEIAALVHTGKFSNPEEEAFVRQVVIERQRKCGLEYLTRLNPLDEFSVADGRLTFANLGERYGFAPRAARFIVRWYVFHNDTGEIGLLGEDLNVTENAVSLPDPSGSEPYLMLELSTVTAGFPGWVKPIRVFLRRENGTFGVAGIER